MYCFLDNWFVTADPHEVYSELDFVFKDSFVEVMAFAVALADGFYDFQRGVDLGQNEALEAIWVRLFHEELHEFEGT